MKRAFPVVALDPAANRSVPAQVAEPFAVFRVREVREAPCVNLVVPSGPVVVPRQVEGQQEVYVIRNRFRRHIPSPQAFNRLGFEWAHIKKISQTELDAYADDALMRAEGDTKVYLICAGQKKHIISPEVFESYGFSWGDISVVSQDDIDDYPDVSLIRAAGDPKVYMLSGGKKHWIRTAAVFNNRGYKWEDIVIVNSTEEEAIPEGENIE